MRLGDWKAFRNAGNQPVQLYNLREDAGESHDVSRAHPEVVRRAEAIMQEARVPSEEFPEPASARPKSG